MQEQKKAYDHDTEVAGTAQEANDATEHRDTAREGAPTSNELTPDQRRRGDGYGPRTHEDTRFTRKEGE